MSPVRAGNVAPAVAAGTAAARLAGLQLGAAEVAWR